MIQSFAFVPESLTVPAGTTVVWMDQDAPPHTVVSDATSLAMPGALFMSGTLQQGQTFSHTFSQPGTYAYHCSIHPFMKGTVIVT